MPLWTHEVRVAYQLAWQDTRRLLRRPKMLFGFAIALWLLMSAFGTRLTPWIMGWLADEEMDAPLDCPKGWLATYTSAGWQFPPQPLRPVPAPPRPEATAVRMEVGSRRPPASSSSSSASRRLKIPRRIIQTNFNRTVPPKMHALMQRLVAMNPTYEYLYFSDAEAEIFTRDHCGARVLAAYLRLRPGAFRADIWRYCVLSVLGGVYLDADFDVAVPLDDILEPDDEWMSAEDNGLDWIYNAFMASTPGHRITKALLSESVARIEDRDQSIGNPLSITGPYMASGVFAALTGMTPLKFGPYRRDGVRLLFRRRSMSCLIGEVVDPRREVSDAAPLRVLIYDKYPEYAAEMSRYRRQGDDMLYHDAYLMGRSFHTNREVISQGCAHGDKLMMMSAVPAVQTRPRRTNGSRRGRPTVVDTCGWLEKFAWLNKSSSVKTGGNGCVRGWTLSEERRLSAATLRSDITLLPVVDARDWAAPESGLEDSSSHLPATIKASIATTARFSQNGSSPASRIPRVIVQNHETRRRPTREVALMHRLRALNPTYDYEFYDADAAGHFTLRYCGSDVARARHRAETSQHRADLFRYCYLWARGGVLVNTDMDVVAPLDAILREHDELILVESDEPATPFFFNGFIAVGPGHPLMEAALRTAIKRLEAKWTELDESTGGVMLHNVWQNIRERNRREARIHGIQESRQQREAPSDPVISGPRTSWSRTVRKLNYVRLPHCAIGAIESLPSFYDAVDAMTPPPLEQPDVRTAGTPASRDAIAGDARTIGVGVVMYHRYIGATADEQVESHDALVSEAMPSHAPAIDVALNQVLSRGADLLNEKKADRMDTAHRDIVLPTTEPRRRRDDRATTREIDATIASGAGWPSSGLLNSPLMSRIANRGLL